MIGWSEDYATGFAQIDEQHRRLFGLLRDYNEAVKAGRGRAVFTDLLEALGGYAKEHFAYEEECMRECQCSAANANQTAHAAFMEAHAEFVRRFEGEGYSDALAWWTLDFLERWFVEHICGVDLELRSCTPRPTETTG